MKILEVLFLFLIGFMVGNAGLSHAATIQLTATLPDSRTNGQALTLAELSRVEVGCGLVDIGPFDVFQTSIPGPFTSLSLLHDFTSPEDRDYFCVAFVVDTGGRISAPSNVAPYVYVAPPFSLELLGLDDVVPAGTINFNFTIQTGTQ